MPSARRVAIVAISVVLAACIPGTFSLAPSDGGPSGDDGPATGPDGAQGDAGPDQTPGIDAPGDQTTSGDSGGPADSSDSAPLLPDGFIQCAAAMPPTQCDLAGGQQCCLSVYGQYGADGGAVYATTQASCEAIGGPNCGFFSQTGVSFQYNFPQTCSTAANCATGTPCCALFSDAGNWMGISCRTTCSAPDKIICDSGSECPSGMCKPETDPIWMHLYPGYCL